MLSKIINHIKKIQNEKEEVRKKYLIIFSSLSTILVIFLWVLFLKYTLPTTPPPPNLENVLSTTTNTSEAKTILKDKNSNSFFSSLKETFSLGINKIYNDVNNFSKEAFSSLENVIVNVKNMVNKENKFEIKNEEELKNYIEKFEKGEEKESIQN